LVELTARRMVCRQEIVKVRKKKRKKSQYKKINKLNIFSKKVCSLSLSKRRVNVFCALTLYLILITSLWTHVFVCAPVAFTHMSPQGLVLPKYNLVGVLGLIQPLEYGWAVSSL
jgi:hypothetical protein